MAYRERHRGEEFRGGAEERGGRDPYGRGRNEEIGRGQRQFGREHEAGGRGQGWQSGSPAWGGSRGDRGRSQHWSPGGYASSERGFSGESGGYGSQGYGSQQFGRYGSEGIDRESGWGGSTSVGWGQSQEFGQTSGYTEGPYESLSRMRGRYTGRGPKNYIRSDERIREDVSDRLEQHGEIDASEIEVRVENGEVTLEGTVEDRRTKRLAEDAAEDCPGVKQVHNRIRVQGNGSERERATSARSGLQYGGSTGTTTPAGGSAEGSQRSKPASTKPSSRSS